MFHVPYSIMADIHAKRLVSDDGVRIAARVIVAERRLLAAKDEEIAVCERKALAVARLKDDLIDENAAIRSTNGDLSKKVARLKPWATIGRICIYGGAAAGTLILLDRTTNLLQ